MCYSQGLEVFVAETGTQERPYICRAWSERLCKLQQGALKALAERLQLGQGEESTARLSTGCHRMAAVGAVDQEPGMPDSFGAG